MSLRSGQLFKFLAVPLAIALMLGSMPGIGSSRPTPIPHRMGIQR